MPPANKMVAQNMAPMVQKIIEPNKPIIIHKNIPAIASSKLPGSIDPMSNPETSIVVDDGFFHSANLCRKLP